ncbi:helix-turn-helix transcriptional regulator [Streptomyces sp. NPDC004237]|uniref:helix-turn-helix transcriptional regulator n=1 Tax=Streptomyces sp. NPDC004237 TaxID=3154455 RepID=UPI0033ABB22E
MTNTLATRAGFTPRGLQVVAGYARGLNIAQVAVELGIAERTVASHTHLAAKALGIRGARQAALVDYAYRHGYLTVDQPRRRPALTPRLEQVLDCAARGLSAQATAAELGIANRTARRHLERLRGALDVHTTARAVAVAWETGLRGRPSAPRTTRGETN